jgi:signal transduction histidine kinase
VSHDLKTPLTSIITYTDLLKKEGLRSKRAPEYLDVLEEKGQRLKKLTDDLFEAAKASSGAVPASVERVDLLSLVHQEIAETETLFKANGLEVIINAPDEHYYVSADGNLLWRVMENIFRNAGKYALSGSRVYIDLRRAERVVFTMKNISAVKLNIPADELMERFQRGDENRTTEGSGLGLAIARDLVRLQHGHFDIIIDGDLFKAVIELAPFKE